MDKQLGVIAAAVILALGLVVAAMNLPGGNVGAGGVPGVALYPQSVTTFTQGGGVFATTTAASGVIAATDIDSENYINANVDNVANLTLPATTSFPGIPNPGDMRQLVIQNSGDSAGTIVAGTGINLQEPDGQNVVIGAGNFVILTCLRLQNTDIMCSVDENIPAD